MILSDEQLVALKGYNDPIVQKLLIYIDQLKSANEDHNSDLIDEVDTLKNKLRKKDDEITILEDELEELEDGIFYGDIYNTLPYNYLFETLNEALRNNSPQKIENILKLII